MAGPTTRGLIPSRGGSPPTLSETAGIYQLNHVVSTHFDTEGEVQKILVRYSEVSIGWEVSKGEVWLLGLRHHVRRDVHKQPIAAGRGDWVPSSEREANRAKNHRVRPSGPAATEIGATLGG